MRKIFTTLAVLLLLSSWFPASVATAIAATDEEIAAAEMDSAAAAWWAPKIYERTLILRNIVIRPGVTSNIEVIVWSNTPLFKPGKILLANGAIKVGIPGWTNAADIWGETAKLELNKPGKIRYFVGINMPTNAAGDLFGNLNLADDAHATLAVMEVLSKKYGARKNIVEIKSHSQGCTVHAGVQDLLRQNGTSLEERFGVEENDFIACTPLETDARWSFIENMNISAFAGAYVKYSPEYGYYVQLDDYSWVGMTFTNKFGAIQNAPPMDQVKEFNVKSPLAATFQLIGLRFGDPSAGEPMFVCDPTHIKVDLPRNLFQGTNTKVYLMEQDTLVGLDEGIPNGEFLTGSRENVIVVEGEGAVHSLVVTRPDLIFGNKEWRQGHHIWK